MPPLLAPCLLQALLHLTKLHLLRKTPFMDDANVAAALEQLPLADLSRFDDDYH
jgi:hypothetical protein